MTSFEEWRHVSGYEGTYQVSSWGRVRRLSRPLFRQLKPYAHGAGYLQVSLCKDGVRAKRLVHRMVAEAFLPNPESLPQVNHINGIKTDNSAANLEWCTNQGNAIHNAYVLRNESTIPKRPVVCLDTGQRYASVSAAARAVGGCSQDVAKCCLGQRARHKGLRWAYAEEAGA